jgi:glycosyltransferase involved in cell wall biosynthesis
MNQMSKMRLDQFVIGASPGDAITDHALLLSEWIEESGFESKLYAESVHPELENTFHSYLSYKPKSSGEVVILHHSIGSDLVDHLLSLDVRIVLIYHNVTPASFFESSSPALAAQLTRGRHQLQSLRSRTLLGLGVSKYDEKELYHLGYKPTGVLPIVLDEHAYDFSPVSQLLNTYKAGGPNLLFVGRLVPNKCQDDLIKLMYHMKRVIPSARLFLVGSPWLATYVEWLRELAVDLDVSDRVVITGHVSQRDLVTYYQLADFYISMSEHEGLGKPLIESMYFGVPIIAYAAAAIPETLGGTGILVHEKDLEIVAELIMYLWKSNGLYKSLVRKQQDHVEMFSVRNVRGIWSKIEEFIRGCA